MRPRATDLDFLPREVAEAQFAQLYADHGRDILAYALRRATPEDAADVVAETFLVAWRRAGEIPAGDEARLWLYGVARLTLANQQRGTRRRALVEERLRTELATQLSTESAPDVESALMHALGRLDQQDREVLMLSGWEDLAPAQIASVLGISPAAARSRLRRARRRLRAELTEAEHTGIHCHDFELEEAR